MKFALYVLIALIIGSDPVHATCYGWKSGDIATINLKDKKNGYYRIWKDRKKLKLAAKLRHANNIKVIQFIEDTCGGDVYLEATVNGRTLRGWTFSDDLVYYTR
jgi:hypothetical protein